MNATLEVTDIIALIAVPAMTKENVSIARRMDANIKRAAAQ